MLIRIETKHSCLTLIYWSFRFSKNFLCFVLFFIIFFLFKLCIHPPFTFHSSYSKSTCQKNNIIRIIFFNLWELWWNHQRIRSLISMVTLQLDKCLEKVESANCARHPRNCFKKCFVIRGFTYLGICASRLFLRSYEITDIKTRQRQATVIHHTNLYNEKSWYTH